MNLQVRVGKIGQVDRCMNPAVSQINFGAILNIK